MRLCRIMTSPRKFSAREGRGAAAIALLLLLSSVAGLLWRGDGVQDRRATAVTEGLQRAPLTEPTDSASATPSDAEAVPARTGTPPPLMTSGDDLEAVVRSLVIYQQWMLENPTATAASEIYRSGSAKGERLNRAMQTLAQRGHRYQCAAPPDVSVVDEVRSSADPDRARVVAHVRRAPCRLLDPSSRELVSQPGYEQRAFSFSLERVSGRWYVLRDDDLGNV